MNRRQAFVVAGIMLLLASMIWARNTFKYEFTETIDDQTIVIRADSKTVGNGSTFINCDYYTTDDQFLGQYGDDTALVSSDPVAVKNFCEDHFTKRQ